MAILICEACLTMFSSLTTLVGRPRLGRWVLIFPLLACLSFSGCCRLDLRGEGFADDDLASYAGKMRPRDENNEPFSFSNKGRQIESNLGVR